MINNDDANKSNIVHTNCTNKFRVRLALFFRLKLFGVIVLGLREGDQVLEWCGMPLTGRTYEEVQRITRTPNGDVEVVVKW